jgi:hypothetical protein
VYAQVCAEHVQYGDYTIPQTSFFDGDLIIIGGNLNLKHTFTVLGDLKIVSGKVFVQSDNSSTTTVNLHVRGDLMVTNTENSGVQDASINIVTGKLDVSGEVFTWSNDGKGFINGRYGITAARLEANGMLDSQITVTGGSAIVGGEIVSNSTTTASVDVLNDVKCEAIVLDARDTFAFVRAGRTIDVIGHIHAKSENGGSYVLAANSAAGNVLAGSIIVDGYGSSYVKTGASTGNIDVKGDLIVTGSYNDAYVEANGGSLKAGRVRTLSMGASAATDAYVKATNEIEVDGSIWAQCDVNNGTAYVRSVSKNIKANDIVTHSGGAAYVSAASGIDVRDGITTRGIGSGGDAYVTTAAQNILVGDITTRGDSSAYISAPAGTIETNYTINTYGNNAYISGRDGVASEHITTYATAGDAYLLASQGAVTVRDLIQLESVSGEAYVKAQNNVTAHYIKTKASTGAYIESTAGSISVVEDIVTESTAGDAYVSATSGNITAQRIKAEAPATKDNSIKSASGSGQFMLVLDTTGTEVIISNAAFDFERDIELDTILTLVGTCTLNGKGHQLNLKDNGKIIVGANAHLYLNNITINNLGGETINCQDNTGTIHVLDTTWSQTADYTFVRGKLNVDGDFLMKGPYKQFGHESTQPITISSNAVFTVGSKVTFYYNTASDSRIAMTDSTSRLAFNNSTLSVAQDLRFTNGTLVFDNVVNFSVATSKSLTFGNGVFANNINFEEHVGSRINFGGAGSYVEQNV